MTAVHRPLLPTRGCTRDPPSSPCATRGSCSWVWAPARGRGRSWPRPGAPPGSAPPGWLVERETREREFLTGKRKCFRLERDYSRLLPDLPRTCGCRRSLCRRCGSGEREVGGRQVCTRRRSPGEAAGRWAAQAVPFLRGRGEAAARLERRRGRPDILGGGRRRGGASFWLSVNCERAKVTNTKLTCPLQGGTALSQQTRT